MIINSLPVHTHLCALSNYLSIADTHFHHCCLHLQLREFDPAASSTSQTVAFGTPACASVCGPDCHCAGQQMCAVNACVAGSSNGVYPNLSCLFQIGYGALDSGCLDLVSMNCVDCKVAVDDCCVAAHWVAVCLSTSHMTYELNQAFVTGQAGGCISMIAASELAVSATKFFCIYV